MNDKEIIQGLIARDNRVTEEFFFVRCRPLFLSIIRKVFDYEVEYDELVNELYVCLMENDAEKLRQFEFRSSVYQWLKVVAIRFFIKKRHLLLDNMSQEPLYDRQLVQSGEEATRSAQSDLQRLFSLMPNKRYASVIQRLMIDGESPEQLAAEMNIETSNLYNIKRRAMAQLTKVAQNTLPPPLGTPDMRHTPQSLRDCSPNLGE